jgi:hypothetical protein
MQPSIRWNVSENVDCSREAEATARRRRNDDGREKERRKRDGATRRSNTQHSEENKSTKAGDTDTE